MTRSYPNTSSPTPKGRVGAGTASKQLIPANDARDELIFEVNHETAKVWFALGPEAVVGEGLRLRESDEPLHVKTQAEVSVITITEGPNEKQTITLAGIEGGTFTLTFDGKTTANLKGVALTKEELAAALEALTTIGAGNVNVTGEPGGPFTVEFKEELKAQDVSTLVANGAKLTPEAEAEATVTVATEVPGGVSVCYVEI